MKKSKKNLGVFTEGEKKQLKEGIKDTVRLGVGAIVVISAIDLLD